MDLRTRIEYIKNWKQHTFTLDDISNKLRMPDFEVGEAIHNFIQPMFPITNVGQGDGIAHFNHEEFSTFEKECSYLESGKTVDYLESILVYWGFPPKSLTKKDLSVYQASLKSRDDKRSLFQHILAGNDNHNYLRISRVLESIYLQVSALLLTGNPTKNQVLNATIALEMAHNFYDELAKFASEHKSSNVDRALGFWANTNLVRHYNDLQRQLLELEANLEPPPSLTPTVSKSKHLSAPSISKDKKSTHKKSAPKKSAPSSPESRSIPEQNDIIQSSALELSHINHSNPPERETNYEVDENKDTPSVEDSPMIVLTFSMGEKNTFKFPISSTLKYKTITINETVHIISALTDDELSEKLKSLKKRLNAENIQFNEDENGIVLKDPENKLNGFNQLDTPEGAILESFKASGKSGIELNFFEDAEVVVKATTTLGVPLYRVIITNGVAASIEINDKPPYPSEGDIENIVINGENLRERIVLMIRNKTTQLTLRTDPQRKHRAIPPSKQSTKKTAPEISKPKKSMSKPAPANISKPSQNPSKPFPSNTPKPPQNPLKTQKISSSKKPHISFKLSPKKFQKKTINPSDFKKKTPNQQRQRNTPLEGVWTHVT